VEGREEAELGAEMLGPTSAVLSKAGFETRKAGGTANGIKVWC